TSSGQYQVANIKETHLFEQDALIASVWVKGKRWVSSKLVSNNLYPTKGWRRQFCPRGQTGRSIVRHNRMKLPT
ncbi:hypothetical protein, partial [Aeromonas sobria]|uniref:hypothetical protein n=1 Tax=Aeromonas sobria TaxID=646 RepID=UPI001CA34CFA